MIASQHWLDGYMLHGHGGKNRGIAARMTADRILYNRGNRLLFGPEKYYTHISLQQVCFKEKKYY